MVTCHKNPMTYLSGVWHKKMMTCKHRVLIKILEKFNDTTLYLCTNCDEEFRLDDL